MAERWVLNASPLILLAHIGQTPLIAELAAEAVIPAAVAAEINAGPVNDPARQWLETGSLPVVEAEPAPELLAWDLGVGETAVLAYALAMPGWVAVLDDAAARKCAESFSIPRMGTLSIIMRARQRNLIPSAAQAIQALVAVGYRIDEGLVITVLRAAVAEDWPPAKAVK